MQGDSKRRLLGVNKARPDALEKMYLFLVVDRDVGVEHDFHRDLRKQKITAWATTQLQARV